MFLGVLPPLRGHLFESFDNEAGRGEGGLDRIASHVLLDPPEVPSHHLEVAAVESVGHERAVGSRVASGDMTRCRPRRPPMRSSTCTRTLRHQTKSTLLAGAGTSCTTNNTRVRR